MHENSKYSVIITTCGTRESAEKIAGALLDQKLAACIQIFDVTSLYTWKGQVNKDNESLLLIKAKAELYNEIEECIRQNHTYEVPEIVQLPIVNGFSSYLQWISEVSK